MNTLPREQSYLEGDSLSLTYWKWNQWRLCSALYSICLRLFRLVAYDHSVELLHDFHG